MSDEEKKKIVSEPPPPTDEIDGEWGEDSAGKAQPAPPAAQLVRGVEASTPSAMKAASGLRSEGADAKQATDDHSSIDEEDEEDEDEDEDEEEEDEDEDEEDEDADARGAPQEAPKARDWLPDWAPYAVLAALVSLSVLVGLGIVGSGSDADADGATSEEAAEPVSPAAKAATKPAAPAKKPGSHP